MSRAFLGEFEQMVLLSILRMGEGAYGLEVRRELEEATGRKVSRAVWTELGLLHHNRLQ